MKGLGLTFLLKKERKKESIFIYLSQCTQQIHYMAHLRFHMF
jgi:hypothetical protein